MSVQLVLKLNRPMPSLLEPAPNRLRTNVCRPLSAKQMTEMAVSRGNGYCGILRAAEVRWDLAERTKGGEG